ncbi:MAG: PfkB family carbohydrate kinase, partial [Actinomycetes bacterium]
HQWGILLWNDGEFYLAPLRAIDVMDRIGGGDGSVGGVIYGILQGWNVEKCAQFGWATGALAATSLLDYGAPADEKQVWDMWKGNARVQR